MSNVPKLRFKQFNGFWALVDWADTVDISTQMVDPKAGEYDHLPHIGPGNIQSFTGKVSDVMLVGESKLISSKFLFHEGDIIYSKIRPNLAKYTRAKSEGLASADAYVLNAKNGLSQAFLYTLLQTSAFYNYSVSVSVRTGMPKINRDELNSFSYYAPTQEEQQKIADFLTAVDTKIEQLTRKEELLKQYKKGVMQKIFSQEIRFNADDGSEFPEWEDGTLGEVADITTGKSNREDSGTEGQYTFFDRSIDVRTSDQYLFDCEALIVAGEGSDFPARYFRGKFDLHQRTYAIFGFKNVSAKFLLYYINQHRSHFLRFAVGSTVKSLRLPIFQKMPVRIPILEEQDKIVSFLSALDKNIAHINTHLESAKTFKKGLLQQMFV